MIGYDDPEFSGRFWDTMAAMELLTYAMEMAENRKVEPRDDIITKLVNASIDGEELVVGRVRLLRADARGGRQRDPPATRSRCTACRRSSTTRTSGKLFKSQRPETAADEIIRWGTPVTVAFQRTATADTELGGQQIQQGERVGLFYRSGNFLDEDVFDHPEQFGHPPRPQPAPRPRRLRRALLPGRQYLAKLEIGLTFFNAIADAMPDIRSARRARAARNAPCWLNGIKRLPVTYR